MKLNFKESFERDLSMIRDSIAQKQIKKLIIRLENVLAISDIPHVKKLSGGKGFYRIRIGDYRVGIVLEGKSVTLVRVLHRREIYRYFP